MARKMQQKVHIVQRHSIGSRTAERRDAVEQLLRDLQKILMTRARNSSSSCFRELQRIQSDFICNIDKNLPPVEDDQMNEDGPEIDSEGDMQLSSTEIDEFLSDYRLREVA